MTNTVYPALAPTNSSTAWHPMPGEESPPRSTPRTDVDRSATAPIPVVQTPRAHQNSPREFFTWSNPMSGEKPTARSPRRPRFPPTQACGASATLQPRGHQEPRGGSAPSRATAGGRTTPLRAPSWSSVLKPFSVPAASPNRWPFPRMEASRFFTWCYPMSGEDLCLRARRVRVMAPGTRPGMTGGGARVMTGGGASVTRGGTPVTTDGAPVTTGGAPGDDGREAPVTTRSP